METGSRYVCLGIDWSQPDQPALRLGQHGSSEPSWLQPLADALGFRITRPERYCSGWFNLTGSTPRHVICESWEVITRSKQCQRCQYLEGFIGVHQAHRRIGELPANIQEYLRQPHYLYIAAYADGSTKVGTAAQVRMLSRLAEQGAATACFIAEAADGLRVRQAEAALSASLGLKQALTTKRKLEALTTAVDLSRIRQTLERTVQASAQIVDSLDIANRLAQPQWWTPSSRALAAFASAPVALYAHTLSTGEHGLKFHGVTGTIAVFFTQPEDGASAFAADLSDLQGRELEFGDFHSPDQAVQAQLF